MIKRTLLAAASASLFAVAASGANAAIIASVGGVALAGQGQTSAFSGAAGFTTYDFNAMPLDPAALVAPYSGNGRIVTGSLSGQYAAPMTPANPDNSRYLAIPRATAGVTSVTVAAPSLSSYFGLWWGSIDDYNSISFFNGNTQVGTTFTGAFIRTLPNPDLTPGTQSEAAYINFAFTAGDVFDRVVLSSSQFALESDNHVFGRAPGAPLSETSVVPVPGAAVLMLSGMFGMLFASRRDRKAVQIA